MENQQCLFCLSWPLEGDKCDCDEAKIQQLEVQIEQLQAERDVLLTACSALVARFDTLFDDYSGVGEPYLSFLDDEFAPLIIEARNTIAQCKAGIQ